MPSTVYRSRHPRRLRRLLATLTMVCAALFGALVPASSASAAALTLVTCPVGVANQTYNPPVTNTPQPTNISINSHYGSCASVTHPSLAYGDTVSAFAAPSGSCLDLLAPATNTNTITWNTGETSVISLNSVFNVVEGELVGTSTGSVVSGKLAGASVVRVVVYLSADLAACSTTGLAHQSGPITLTITGP